jgi:hypothetical protein
MKSLFLIALLLVKAAYSFTYGKLTVTNPNGGSFAAGSYMYVQWQVTGDQTAKVDIELLNDDNVFNMPYPVKTGVESNANGFGFTIPSNLQTSSKYRIRVWGAVDEKNQPQLAFTTETFTIDNTANEPVTTFLPKFPYAGSTLYICERNTITWDFPPLDSKPYKVNIYLYRAGSRGLNYAYVITRGAMFAEKSFTFTLFNMADVQPANNTYFITIWTDYTPKNFTLGHRERFAGNTHLFSVDWSRNGNTTCPPISDANNKFKPNSNIRMITAETDDEGDSNSSTVVVPTVLFSIIMAVMLANFLM